MFLIFPECLPEEVRFVTERRKRVEVVSGH